MQRFFFAIHLNQILMRKEIQFLFIFVCHKKHILFKQKGDFINRNLFFFYLKQNQQRFISYYFFFENFRRIFASSVRDKKILKLMRMDENFTDINASSTLKEEKEKQHAIEFNRKYEKNPCFCCCLQITAYKEIFINDMIESGAYPIRTIRVITIIVTLAAMGALTCQILAIINSLPLYFIILGLAIIFLFCLITALSFYSSII